MCVCVCVCVCVCTDTCVCVCVCVCVWTFVEDVCVCRHAALRRWQMVWANLRAMILSCRLKGDSAQRRIGISTAKQGFAQQSKGARLVRD